MRTSLSTFQPGGPSTLKISSSWRLFNSLRRNASRHRYRSICLGEWEKWGGFRMRCSLFRLLRRIIGLLCRIGWLLSMRQCKRSSQKTGWKKASRPRRIALGARPSARFLSLFWTSGMRRSQKKRGIASLSMISRRREKDLFWILQEIPSLPTN